MSEQMTFHDFCEAVSSLTEFTVIYLLFHPVKGKKTKTKLAITRNVFCVSRQVGDWRFVSNYKQKTLLSKIIA